LTFGPPTMQKNDPERMPAHLRPALHQSLQQSLQQVRDALAAARRVCVLTGAGMSAESGIPTFRDALSGLWAQFDPMEMASAEGFRAHPERVWRWYAERRAAAAAARPNAGHEALAAHARARPGHVTLVTQNVDDLHQRAGQTDALRLHGDIHADLWLEPCQRRPMCDTAAALPGAPPHCGECGNRVRPGVVWFGEMLPPPVLQAAERAAADCQVMLVVGTSGAVWPAAGLAAAARRAGARVVIVNPHASEIDDEAQVLLQGTAATVLPALFGPAGC
jgi:NAD-dependent deacetylase